MPDGTIARRVAMLAHSCYLRDPRVRREAEALAEMGIQVHVLSLAEERGDGFEPRRAIVNGVQIHRLPLRKKRGGFLRYLYEYLSLGVLGALQLASLQLRGKLTVVHIHNMPDILVLAALIPRLGGSKVLLDVHDPMPELFMTSNDRTPDCLVVRLLRLQEKISCALAHRVISVNESMRENLQTKGVGKDKLFVLHNFPDPKLFPVCERPLSWPRGRDSLSLLYCGTVTEHYDLDLAVRAIARLAGEVPIKLKILGGGNKLTEVLNLASALGVRDSVEHVGLVALESVPAEMKKADIGISCHRAGAFGDLYFSTKIVEYMTQGLPVLSPRTQTITRYLPEDCLFYYEAGSDLAMADVLRSMWHNPGEVLRRLTRARDLLPSLSWQSEKIRFLSFYAGLMNDGNAGAHGEHEGETGNA
jgi:glycosyltransferase involved in cell wall biosynthesis